MAFWDYLPTVCDIAGVSPNANTDGISFCPALKGDMDVQAHHPYLYWEFNEWFGPMQAVRMGQWKGIRMWEDKTNDFADMALYDLETDLTAPASASGPH